MGTAIKHPVADRVKSSFVIRAFWRLALSIKSARMSEITNDDLNQVWYRMLYSCTHKATMGVIGLNK